MLDPGVEQVESEEVGRGPCELEALIKEARRLRRRRWIIGITVTALAAAGGVVGYLLASGPPTSSDGAAPPGHSAAPASPVSARSIAPTHSPDLLQPGTLAMLPDANLLILDGSRDQILELDRDGALSVFAGTGRRGFTGDGGPARDAELDFTSSTGPDMAVTPSGAVDVLDNGSCRIRQIDGAGVIRTIVQVPLVKVQRGMACPVSNIAVSPAGTLYVATVSAIERLSPTGHLLWVAGSRVPHGRAWSPHPTRTSIYLLTDSMAFDRGGNLYIANFSPKLIWKLTPAGRLSAVRGGTYATGLALDPSGQILVGTHFGEIQKVTSRRVRSFYDVNPRRVSGIHWPLGPEPGVRANPGFGEFQEDGIAVTKTGAIYVDNDAGNGFGDGTVLVRITPSGRAALVPIRTPLAATLPKVGAPGFPVSLYPPAVSSKGSAVSSCPSSAGLRAFTPAAAAQARRIARNYLGGQFASDIVVTDRSWWTADFGQFTNLDDNGKHAVTSEAAAQNSPAASGLAQACGHQLVRDSVTVTVGKSAYSDFAGTLYFLDRDGHPLVYDVR